MKEKNKIALIYLFSGLGGTAFFFGGFALLRLICGDSVRLQALGICFCLFGAPLVVAALCEFLLYDIFRDNDIRAMVAGLVAVWGGFVVKMLFDDLIWVGCFAISMAASAFIIHYLTLKDRAKKK